MSVIEAPAPAVTVTTADILERAADLLEEFGWRQGWYGSKDEGAFCLLGACAEAAIDLGMARSIREGEDLVEPALGFKCSPAKWNDAPGRTKAEVVARLRQAAQTHRQ